MGEIKGRFEGNCNGGTIAGNITGELYGKLNRCKMIGSIIQKGITEINLSYVLGEICWSKLVGVPPTPPQFNRVTMNCKFFEESCCSTKPDHGNCPSGYSVSEDGLKCQKCPEGQISDGQTCRRIMRFLIRINQNVRNALQRRDFHASFLSSTKRKVITTAKNQLLATGVQQRWIKI